MHVNEMIYNRGDLAWRSLAIATVAANASGATWKRRNLVFVLLSFVKALRIENHSCLQGGRSWQHFSEGKNGHQNFRDKCVFFACNCAQLVGESGLFLTFGSGTSSAQNENLRPLQ